MKLLHLDSSITGPQPVSRQLTAEIVAAQLAQHPGAEIVYHDLAGEPVFHLSPAHLAAFQGAPVETADYVVCSGLFDEYKETPDDYRDLIAAMRSRGLFMVCANPDLVVERGTELFYCAGAIADLYAYGVLRRPADPDRSPHETE